MTDPVAIRASSLPGLFDCPARWEAVQLRKLKLPSTGKAILGKAVHSSTAAYDVARLRGNFLTIDEAAAAAVDVIHQPEEEVVWDDGLTPAKTEKIALDLHGLYCRTIADSMSYLSVEVTCEDLIIEDLGLTLTGTVDRVFLADDEEIGIADIKTGKDVVAVDGTVNAFPHAYQLGVYELLAMAAIGRPVTAPARVIGLQAGRTSKGQRAGIGQVPNPKATLIGDDLVPGVLQDAAKLVHSGVFHGNPRSLMCSGKYCPIWHLCRYRR